MVPCHVIIVIFFLLISSTLDDVIGACAEVIWKNDFYLHISQSGSLLLYLLITLLDIEFFKERVLIFSGAIDVVSSTQD